MSKESLINKHRPTDFSEIIGQDEVVVSFHTSLKERTSHAFLFTGPAGVGKTSLSRLGAKQVGSTTRANLIEVDAATYNGVDDFRNLTEGLKHRPLGGGTKSLIIDECHALSRQAWQSALKMVEEPPDWVYWFFCTTDVAKVPDTIKSRCASYTLKLVKTSELFEYLLTVVKAEGMQTSRSIVELCAKQSAGSPRKALSNLAVCYAAENREEAAKLIANEEIAEGGAPLALARAIANGWKWDKIQPIIASMVESDENPEGVRHVVLAYFTKVITGNTDENLVCNALRVLDNFSEPYNTSDGISPLIQSVGRSIFT